MFSPRVVKILKANLLTITTILAVLLSIIVGISLRLSHEGEFSPRIVMYVNFLGDLFLRMIRAIILPLIISSLIASIAPLDVSLSKKIGVRAIVYILTTTVIAVILGIVLVLAIKPGGKGIDDANIPGTNPRKENTLVDTLLDLVRSVYL
jgi:Na+/H+-dicarboxylate symporter